jgi:hypothetical protein
MCFIQKVVRPLFYSRAFSTKPIARSKMARAAQQLGVRNPCISAIFLPLLALQTARRLVCILHAFNSRAVDSFP